MGSLRIPLGYTFKFEPKDHHILTYLSCKCKGESLPWEGCILDVDIYQLPDPGVLFERISDKVVYVFTKLKKVGKNRKRVDRVVAGNKTWKGVDGRKPIYDARGQLVGEKRNFVLMNNVKKKLGYNMTEFSLDDRTLRNSRFDDYVVCKIKQKIKKSRNLKDETEDGIFAAYPQETHEQFYQVSESYQGMISSHDMPMLSEYPQSDKNLSSCGEYYDRNISLTTNGNFQVSNVSTTATEDGVIAEYPEEAQQCYLVPQSHQGMISNDIPMLSVYPQSDKNLSSCGEYIYGTQVSTPATEYQVTVYSEQVYQQHHAVECSVSIQAPQEESQQSYLVSKSYQEISNDMPSTNLLCGSEENEMKLLGLDYFDHDSLWTTDSALQEQKERSKEVLELEKIYDLASAPSVPLNDY